MQLNSIIIMDIVALGGAAAGISVALWQLSVGTVGINTALLIILLSADFFLPMRRLGSYFHIAMNGMAASDKIFKVLDIPEPESKGTLQPVAGDHFMLSGINFSWDGTRDVLHDVHLDIPAVGVTALVGESGSGKSTIAALLAGRLSGYVGDALLGGKPLAQFDAAALARYVTSVPSASYLFAGTVKENLQMAAPNAEDEELWQVLELVQLAAYLRSLDGLDTQVQERGENLSGGQRQRLALARALLTKAPVLILDEATSNIDVESDDAIMSAVQEVARYQAVVVISHRLADCTPAQRIYVLKEGCVVGSGSHKELLGNCPVYADLWNAQQELEHFGSSKNDEEVRHERS